VNVAFSDAAANTVKAPGAAGAAALDDTALAGFELDEPAELAAAGLDVAGPEVAAALVVAEAALVLVELHPTIRVATHSAARVATTPRRRVVRGRLTRVLPSIRICGISSTLGPHQRLYQTVGPADVKQRTFAETTRRHLGRPLDHDPRYTPTLISPASDDPVDKQSRTLRI